MLSVHEAPETKDHIIDEKYQYEDIGLHVFEYELFEEEKGWWTR